MSAHILCSSTYVRTCSPVATGLSRRCRGYSRPWKPFRVLAGTLGLAIASHWVGHGKLVSHGEAEEDLHLLRVARGCNLSGST